MLCYHPITIVNPTKYVSLKYRDRFLLRVPCGQCAACQENKRREYYLRSFYHAQDCLSRSDGNAFVLFDTLTYAPKFLPHICDFCNTKYNYPCFDSSHVRKFVVNLRQRCKRWYNSNFDFFLSSEYGTSEFHSHRPHYHVLFFVNGNITPLQFSRLVADTWLYGRTDGIPYKSDYYVMSNVLDQSAKKIRILKYVTKYISKSCQFTKEINKRVNAILYEIASRYPEYASADWLNSLAAAQYREKLMRHIGQFHRQSTGFGSSLLSDLDVNEVMRTGQLRVVDNKKVVLSIALPTYYKRKLFYEQYEVDGTLVWCPTDLGVEYLRQQQLRLKSRLEDYYYAAFVQSHIKSNVKELVDYVVDYRGRIKADLPESTLQQRLKDIDLYKYATRYDRHQFGKLGLTSEYLGNSTIGYYTFVFPPHISLFSFGQRFSYFDDEKEKLLQQIDDVNLQFDVGKQKAYELRQHLTNLAHYLSHPF